MTTETRTEIVLFSGLAAFLAFLWWMNRQNGAGNGLASPALSLTLPSDAPGFNVGATTYPPASSYPLNYTGGDTAFNVGGPTITNAGAPSACGCSGNLGAAQFGSLGDLQAFLATNQQFMQDASDGLTNWN